MSQAVPLLTEGKRPPGRTCGLDTVGLSFEVLPDFELKGGTVTVHNMGLVGEEFTTVKHNLPGGGFVALGKGGKAWVEASAKRAGEGENVFALSAGEALESMREAVWEASAFCNARPGVEFENCEVVRLDVVRDFDDVLHVPELLDGLAGVPRDSRYKTRRWADATRNRAESLRVGPKAHGGELYDKHIETGGRAPKGRLRAEFRLHRDQLRSEWARSSDVLVPSVDSISQEKLEVLGRLSFERYAFDREVLGMASLSSKVFAANGLSRNRQAVLFSFLVAPGFAESMSKQARSEYRALSRELGVALKPEEVQGEVEPVLVRLDFESGRELCRVA